MMSAATRWQSGYAADCKSANVGSIPALVSMNGVTMADQNDTPRRAPDGRPILSGEGIKGSDLVPLEAFTGDWGPLTDDGRVTVVAGRPVVVKPATLAKDCTASVRISTKPPKD